MAYSIRSPWELDQKVINVINKNTYQIRQQYNLNSSSERNCKYYPREVELSKTSNLEEQIKIKNQPPLQNLERPMGGTCSCSYHTGMTVPIEEKWDVFEELKTSHINFWNNWCSGDRIEVSK